MTIKHSDTEITFDVPQDLTTAIDALNALIASYEVPWCSEEYLLDALKLLLKARRSMRQVVAINGEKL